MSLFESKNSTGEASLTLMFEGVQETKSVRVPSLEEIAFYIVRGGWPSNIHTGKELAHFIPKSYMESILDKDIHDDKT